MAEVVELCALKTDKTQLCVLKRLNVCQVFLKSECNHYSLQLDLLWTTGSQTSRSQVDACIEM